MNLVYIGFGLLSAFMLLIISLPFLSQTKKKLSPFFSTVGLMLSFIWLTFLMTGGTHGLKDWLNGGQAHYLLMTQVQSLGGIEGMIAKLEARVKAHPEDETAKGMLERLKN